MKKIGKIIGYASAALIIVFSLIFIVFEGRNLFSGDWSIYENKVDGFIRYLFRLIIALFAFSLGVFTYPALGKKGNETLRVYYYFGSLALLLSAIIISLFSSNYMELLFISLSSLYFVGAIFYFLASVSKRKKSKQEKGND